MSLSQDNIQNLLLALQQTISSSNKDIREAAEKTLDSFQQKPFDFINSLFSLLLSDISIDHNTRMAIIIHTSRMVTRGLIKGGLNEHNRIDIIKLYLNYLVSPNVNKIYLVNMSEGLETVLSSTEKQPHILSDLTEMLLTTISNISIESMNGMIMILKTIISCKALTKNNVNKVIKGSIDIMKHILQVLLSQLEQCNNNQTLYLYICDMIANLYELLYKSIAKLKRVLSVLDGKNRVIFSLNVFVPIGIQILSKNVMNNSIVSFTGIRTVDMTVNNMKIMIFKFINFTLFKMIAVKEKEMKEGHSNLIKMIILTLENVVNERMGNIFNMTFEETIEEKEQNDLSSNYKYSLLISHMIIYLQRIFDIESFKENFLHITNNIFKSILLPLLIITKSELEQCVNPNKFIEVQIDAEDIIHQNKNKTIKSSVALFIKNIFSNSISKDNFIVNYSLEMLIHSLHINDITTNIVLPNDKVSQLLINDDFKKIDLSLLVLCIIGDCQIESTNQDIQITFEKIQSLLFSKELPVYIKHKVLLFIRQYVLIFYSPEMEQFLVIIQYLFESMLQNEYLLISKEASDILNELLNEYENFRKNSMSSVISHFMPMLIETIKTSRVMTVFDVLLEIEMKYENSQQNKEIFINLCKRVDCETQRNFRLTFKSPKKHSQLSFEPYDPQVLINKLFNVIRAMINNKQFVIENLPTISEALTPLFSHIKNLPKIDFDEDIILIMTTILNYLHFIPQFAYELLPILYKYPEKKGGMLLDVYELVNEYIAYGSKVIESNQMYLKAMADIFNVALNCKKVDKSPFYGCLLIQTWMIQSNTIPMEVFRYYYNICINKLNELYQKELENEEQCINYVGYLTLLYVGFINYESTCIEELSKVNKVNDILLWIKRLYSFDYICNYQIKLIVIALSHMISSDYISKDNTIFIEIGYHLLYRQMKSESKELKNILKKDISNNDFVKEEINEEEDYKENKESINPIGLDSKKEINELVRVTTNPNKDTDEFELFNATIEKYKDKYTLSFAKWAESLSDNDKLMVSSILKLKRIKINDNNFQYSIPRQIINIKRSSVNK